MQRNFEARKHRNKVAKTKKKTNFCNIVKIDNETNHKSSNCKDLTPT